MLTAARQTVRRHRHALLASLLVAAVPFGAALPRTAAAAPGVPACKKPSGVIAERYGNYLFRQGHALWACTAYYGDPARTVRLGPWSPGVSRAAFDGATAVWTVAGPKVEGVPVDRVWAADAPAGRAWIKGVRPINGRALDDTDARVAYLRASGDAVAWVTGGGAVMMGAEAPQTTIATPIGANTLTAIPASRLGVPQGLRAPLTAKGHRLLVGRWTNLTPKALGRTIDLYAGEGDGDECGGAAPWNLTVRPLPGQAPVGARWDSDWTSTSRACRGL